MIPQEPKTSITPPEKKETCIDCKKPMTTNDCDLFHDGEVKKGGCYYCHLQKYHLNQPFEQKK